MKWEYLREEEFKQAIEKSGGLCVMCLGCMEKHGQHLPVGTDSLAGDKIVELAAERAGVVMFPTTMWLGDVVSSHAVSAPETMGKRGFIGINPHTLLTVLEELCDEIARNGFTKILLVNCHGGNIALLNHFLRCQSYEFKPYATMSTFAFSFPDMETQKLISTLTLRKDEFPYITKDDIETLKRYAKTGYEGIYNVYIMDETHTILACGASAVTKLREPNGDYIERIFNFKYPYEYISRFEEIIGRKRGINDFYAKYSLFRSVWLFT